MSSDACTRCGRPELGASWGAFYADFAPIIDWPDDVGPRGYCPQCATSAEASHLAGALGYLLLTIGALEDPSNPRPYEELCRRIDAFIEERLVGDGDPR